jgi:choline dehydrogenase-like flavoprotein
LERDLDGLRHYVRQTAKTVFHPVGTAKMGPETDRMAVVDAELRVRGVTGLRVADASVMPTLISGNTNAPTMMIAERCARFIAQKARAAAA